MLDRPSAKVSERTIEYRTRVVERTQRLERTLRDVGSVAGPWVWEVGCGHGHFLTAYAAAHPKEICVGIDIVRDRIARATRKCQRARLSNLHFVLAEAHEFLTALAPEVRFSRVFVLFPDPWPKRRHHKNRLLQPNFLATLASRVGENGRLHFRTDYEPYFQEADALIRADPGWEVVSEPWPFETETVFQARSPQYFSLIAQRRNLPT